MGTLQSQEEPLEMLPSGSNAQPQIARLKQQPLLHIPSLHLLGTLTAAACLQPSVLRGLKGGAEREEG